MRAVLAAVLVVSVAVVPAASAQSPTTTRVGLRGPAVTGVGGPTESTVIPTVTIAPTMTTVPGTPVPLATSVPVVSVPPVTIPSATIPVTVPPGTSVSANGATNGATNRVTTSSVRAASTTTLAKSGGPTSTTLVPPPATGTELRAQVRAALAKSTAAQRGVYVVVDGLGALVDDNSELALPPASSQKVVIAGTALLQLGGDHRFTTLVRADGPVQNGVLDGDLVLVGGGDPSFTANDLLDLAASVYAAGVRTVTGDLVVDDSHFDLATGNAGWKPKFQPGEVGALSALLVDQNKRGDTATKTDPGLANGARFKAFLAKRKVVVDGIVRRSTAGVSMPVLASHRSAPLSDLVAHMLKKSDNTYAEVLLKELGAQAGNASTAGGIATVESMFDRFGLARPVLGDGSGLSSVDRTSARRLVSWLTRLDATDVASTMRSSLAVACVDGTLRSRMCGTPAAGVVTAKTGAIDYVVTIAGFTKTASGRTAVFAFLLSGVTSSTRGRAAVDQALVALTSFRG